MGKKKLKKKIKQLEAENKKLTKELITRKIEISLMGKDLARYEFCYNIVKAYCNDNY